MINILIADDHALIRAGLKQLVAETADLSVAGEAEHGRDVFALLQQKAFDVLVLDISLPDKSGLEVLKDVKCAYPTLPVLILSVYPEEQYAVRVLKAGASGYIVKASAPEELIAAIRKVTRGGKYITASLAERLANDVGPAQSQPLHQQLSDREYAVLCRLASGKTVTEIAAELCLSPKTISTYRARILSKMHLTTTAELMHYAMQHGLVE